MIHLGTVQTCTVRDEKQQAYTLEKGKKQLELPVRYVTRSLSAGEEVRVFVYKNKKGSMVATMTLPDITVDSFGWATVADVVPRLGVFLHIGIEKDMLLSKDDLPLFQEVWPKRGDKLYATLVVDKKNMLFAKLATEEDIMKHTERAPASLQNEKVTGLVYRTGKVGSFIWTTDRYRGFLHASERDDEPRLGQHVQARVTGVKEDGTVNLSCKPLKEERIGQDAEKILLSLSRNQGEISYSDKSDPRDIQREFQLSKAAFKRAVGRLLKQGLIEQTGHQTIRFKQ
ncbi:S1 RNA-binding domain-containing protein [Bacillus piscicola]|uniref:CvfB family protein n=1 Tax=Bacillus piscicola TaxID=1632684 RepID=UPI001F096C62|nr:S1-like domain-containing RNA-binding protein [Bacillus piscicola]